MNDDSLLVLIAEDEAVTRKLLEKSVSKWGYRVRVACDGNEAWEFLRTQPGPLVGILDWMMPGFTGPEVCRKVRGAIKDYYHYLIILTGKTETESMLEGLRSGADDFMRKPFNAEELQARLSVAERIIRLHAQVQQASQDSRLLLQAIPTVLIRIGENNLVRGWNDQAEAFLKTDRNEAKGKKIDSLKVGWDWGPVIEALKSVRLSGGVKKLPSVEVTRENEGQYFLDIQVSRIIEDDPSSDLLLCGTDITQSKTYERQLNQAQKLESIGALAAGIAHEINTPMQYVQDNTSFLKEMFDEVAPCLPAFSLPVVAEVLPAELREATQGLDVDYFTREVPQAFSETLDGIERVVGIVKAMKAFSHPGGLEKTTVDINEALRTTCTVSKNTWKYVSDLKLDLQESLPTIRGYPAELNQVFLNIIVNAAEAMREQQEKSADKEKGEIIVKTFSDDDAVVVTISDNGPGIPENVRARVFDPFFTTKQQGKGSGQGLYIAHNIIVEKHKGEICLDSVMGEGTTFTIRLPR